MDRKEIDSLAAELEETLRTEYETVRCLTRIAAQADQCRVLVLSKAYADGLIAGKNADARKREEAIVLGNSDAFMQARHEVVLAEKAQAMASIARKRVESVIGLTKAWLYSLSGMTVTVRRS